MGSDTSNALNAIGTLIGYIGTEVATDDFFDRLLWPRRAYNGFTWKHVAKMALLMPMGGPLHKAALSTLDGFYRHGLFERQHLGHMLGTAFYRDTMLGYKAYGEEPGYEKEFVRNGLWAKAVMKTPFPKLRRHEISEESGQKPISQLQVRQKVCVSHLKLFSVSNGEKFTSTTTVFDDANRPSLRTYLALFTTEISAIVIAILVASIWKSPFAALWLLPLTLKIISTGCAVDREKLVVPDPKPKRAQISAPNLVDEEKRLYEIRNPAGGFVIIEGRADIVLQFFRHYGHPVRAKGREIIQIAMVVAFTLVFPLGLVCSTLWMTDALQKVWVGYQLYATMAMYVYRYAGGHLWATTEEQIGDAFLRSEKESSDGTLLVKLQSSGNSAIGARLERTCHNRFGEAKVYMEELIVRRRPFFPRILSTSSTLVVESDTSGVSEKSENGMLATKG
ncbi:hypothetical protein BDV96DRAFT_561299 [Lophiotrema nucula]|uniref:Uncharacterized protein n=1 Tax=Lophiotrema nucula TaxID=690887 RepID=A0A6A5ZWT3_9PLEO|nr:hypothetical protein BDV96DRAFT_561299 [Lophiotrema nucula]